MTISLVIAGAAACAQPQPVGQTPDGPAAPKVNRVVLAVDPPSAEANETRMLGQTTLFQLRPMYEYLIDYDGATGNLIPGLAEEWKLEPDGSGYRFKLRKGAMFQKGNGEFKAQDVVYTHNDLIRQDSLHNEATWYRQTVKSIDVINDSEIVFRLNPGGANFINSISGAEHVMEIISKAHHEKQGDPTMQTEPTAGTGPYQYKERSLNQFIRYEKRPDGHWRDNPDFPEFEFRFAKEASTRLAALITGEVHIAALPQDLLAQAESQGSKIIKSRVAGPRTFLNISCCFIKDVPKLEGWMFPESPLMDVRVRKALNHAVNRDEINKAFFAGKGEIMYHAHLHPSRPGWNPDWQRNFQEEYGFNQAKARQLLAEAGYGLGKPLRTNLHIQFLPNVPGATDITEAIATQWRAVGVEPNLVNMDSVERTAQQRAMRFSNDFFISGTSSRPLIGSNAYFTSILPRNAGVEDPECDAILLKINVELDMQKAEPLWRQFGDCTYKKHFAIPLVWFPAEAAVNSKIVADYVFPGEITGTWTHVQNIKAAR